MAGIGEYAGLRSIPRAERVIFPVLQKHLRAGPDLQQRHSSAASLVGGVARRWSPKVGMAGSRLLVCDRPVGQPAISRPGSLFMEITSITGELFQTQFVGNQDCGLCDDRVVVDRKSTHLPHSLHCDGVRVCRVRRWNRSGTEDSIAVRKVMAAMTRYVAFATSAFALVTLIFFLWMFFAAATLERTADLGWVSASAGRDVRPVAYEFAARWRHGMSGNSPIYMPGFFAVAIASWFWCNKKGLLRMLSEGFILLCVAAVCAAVLAPYAAARIVSDFKQQESVGISQFCTAGTWIAWAQGIYSLLTWTTVVIASRWSIKLRSPKPLLVPLVLNFVLGFIRPWTVADFTSQWLKEALDGEPAAVISFLLVPILAAFLAWVEVRASRSQPAPL